ncbi:ATPase [Mycobacterium haemophilum]
MSAVPGHNEPSVGGFRAHPRVATPPRPGETGPTQRLTGLGRETAQPTREQRTRRTVDLSLATHRALDLWQQQAADHLGVARVTGQEVFTALIEQLLTDPKLSAQVTRTIQARR